MKRIIIGIAMAICFTIGFTTGGSGKHPSSGSMPSLAVQKVFASEGDPGTVAVGTKPDRNNPVFSWPMILYLSTAVIGIVAFRRDTCS